jgi:hypothetical protein
MASVHLPGMASIQVAFHRVANFHAHDFGHIKNVRPRIEVDRVHDRQRNHVDQGKKRCPRRGTLRRDHRREPNHQFLDRLGVTVWHLPFSRHLFPITPGRYRVIADLPPTAVERSPAPTLEEVQAVLTQRGPAGLVASDPIWLAAFRINGRKVVNYRSGRVFLVGDAAHVHSPAGGQGMNTGMQDAFNLAWKLALVVRKTCGEDLFDSYSAERSKVGDEVLKAAARLTTVGTLRNPVAQSIRNLVGHVMLGLPAVEHALVDTMTEVSIGYPDSPLNGPGLSGGARPRPGERVAPIEGQSPVGTGGAPLFALFAERNAATTDLLRRFEGLLDPEIRPPFRDGGVWLVRPDGYVVCSTGDAEAVAGCLNRMIGSAKR